MTPQEQTDETSILRNAAMVAAAYTFCVFLMGVGTGYALGVW